VYPYTVSEQPQSSARGLESNGTERRDRVTSKRLWIPGLILGLAVCLYYFGIELYLLGGELGFPLDDSWIHLQFARNLATGHGLSFNPGILVPGSTAPLWTALLSIGFLIPGNPLVWSKLLGILFYLVGCWLTYVLARELGLGRQLSIVATLLTGFTSWLAWSALSGLEIPLFVVLSLAGIVLHVRERHDSSGLPLALPVLALSFLARPEAGLLIVAAVADRFLHFRTDESGDRHWSPPAVRPLLLGLVLVAVIVGPVVWFNFWVTGSPLPTTFGAKSHGVARTLPEIGYLYTVFGIFFQAQPWMALLACTGALVLLFRLGGKEDRGLLPALWMLGLPLAYGLIDTPGKFSLVGNFGRYYFPLFPIVIVLGMLAIATVAEATSRRTRSGLGRKAVRIAMLLILFLPTLTELAQGAGRYGQSVVNVHDSDVRVARWLAGRLPPEAVLGVGDIGAIKFLLPNPVVDLAGIANPEIKVWGAARFLEHHRPDYLVIFPNWLQRVTEDLSAFEAVHQVPIEDNITMAGDVLVVYATPWTRHVLVEPDSGATP
jgi:hypothetical protein